MVIPMARDDSDLDTRVRSAIGGMEFQDVQDVVVDQSYGTVVFTGVADRVPVAITTSNSTNSLLPALAPAPS